MKRIILTMTVFAMSLHAQAQCDPSQGAIECVPKLATGFNYLKTFTIKNLEPAPDKYETSYVFTKGTTYLMNLCEEDKNNKVILSIFDSKRNLIASSANTKENASSIAFNCSSTGIYYIQYTYLGTASYCGGSSMGFRKNTPPTE